jgi:hypothetical protein
VRNMGVRQFTCDCATRKCCATAGAATMPMAAPAVQMSQPMMSVGGPIQYMTPQYSIPQQHVALGCEFYRTGRGGTRAIKYTCNQCSLTGRSGICYNCAQSCHRGHQGLVASSKPVTFYCDCGGTRNCNNRGSPAATAVMGAPVACYQPMQRPMMMYASGALPAGATVVYGGAPTMMMSPQQPSMQAQPGYPGSMGSVQMATPPQMTQISTPPLISVVGQPTASSSSLYPTLSAPMPSASGKSVMQVQTAVPTPPPPSSNAAAAAARVGAVDSQFDDLARRDGAATMPFASPAVHAEVSARWRE